MVENHIVSSLGIKLLQKGNDLYSQHLCVSMAWHMDKKAQITMGLKWG